MCNFDFTPNVFVRIVSNIFKLIVCKIIIAILLFRQNYWVLIYMKCLNYDRVNIQLRQIICKNS